MRTVNAMRSNALSCEYSLQVCAYTSSMSSRSITCNEYSNTLRGNGQHVTEGGLRVPSITRSKIQYVGSGLQGKGVHVRPLWST